MLDVDEGGILIVSEAAPTTIDAWRDSYPVCKPRGPVEGKLDDGWTLEFTCPALDPSLKGATTYFVHVQRTIAGKHVACGTYGSTQETAATVRKACRTLRPVR